MNTAENLIKEFGTQTPELFEVGKRYLRIKNKYVLNRKAASGELPVKTLKMHDSNKAPYLVDVVELAKFIDRQ